jgi:hypothetical protein
MCRRSHVLPPGNVLYPVNAAVIPVNTGNSGRRGGMCLMVLPLFAIQESATLFGTVTPEEASLLFHSGRFIVAECPLP